MAAGANLSRFRLLFFCLLACCCSGSAWADGWRVYSGSDGRTPPSLALSDMEGRTVDLAALRGKVVLVNFWATWCEPCRAEMPSLNRLQQRLRDRNFKVIAVNIGEGRARIQQFLATVPVDLTIVRDADSELMKAWRVRILPSSFLIDQHGLLRYQLVGDADWSDTGLQGPILELLDRNNPGGRFHSTGEKQQ